MVRFASAPSRKETLLTNYPGLVLLLVVRTASLGWLHVALRGAFATKPSLHSTRRLIQLRHGDTPTVPAGAR